MPICDWSLRFIDTDAFESVPILPRTLCSRRGSCQSNPAVWAGCIGKVWDRIAKSSNGRRGPEFGSYSAGS